MEGPLKLVGARNKAVASLLCISIASASVAGDVQLAWCATPDSTSQHQGVQAQSQGAGVAEPAAKPEVFRNCIKYLGGPGFPDFKGRESWNNTLTVTGTEGICEFGIDGIAPVHFPLGDVTSILYGQASSRQAGVWISVGVILAPVALLGLLHKSRKHNVLISWKDANGKEGGVFFEAQADYYRNVLNTLSYRTGKPVLADQGDRKWLMTQGVQAQLDPAAASATK